MKRKTGGFRDWALEGAIEKEWNSDGIKNVGIIRQNSKKESPIVGVN